MYQGFWSQLPRPIVGLSPMDGVTDQPYRFIQKKYGNPDVIITEFTSAEGLARNAVRLFDDFVYDESQRPVVAQIFGKEPESFYITALMVCALGFDGLDINMGCPAKNVSQHGSGAALIRQPELAQSLVRAAQKGVEDWYNGYKIQSLPIKNAMKEDILRRHLALPTQYQERRKIPVSVKTRIGFDVPCVEEWIPRLLEVEPAVISLHGRTLKQLYGGQADWDSIRKAAEIVHTTDTLILGNGDILDQENYFTRIKESGVDGALIGRATYGNPWILKDIIAQREGLPHPERPSIDQIIDIVLEHCQIFEKVRGEHGFLPMRKHLGWYIKGFPFASDFRTALVLANSANEVKVVLDRLKDRLASDRIQELAD